MQALIEIKTFRNFIQEQFIKIHQDVVESPKMWDSLHKMLVINAIDEEFKVLISDDTLNTFDSLEELLIFIKAQNIKTTTS
jgi:acyl carrier protein